MNACSRLFFGLVLIFLSATCSDNADAQLELSSLTFDFNHSEHDWQPGFSDFPSGPSDSATYQLKAAYTQPPVNSDDIQKSFMLSGTNHSDDLFMYLKRKVEGLQPGAEYVISFEVEFASNAARGAFGIGGSPGESVFLKVGAAEFEPKSVVQEGEFRMNIDKGNQAQDGQHMVQIGDISVPEETSGYVLTNRTNSPYNSNSSYSKPLRVRANSSGELWLIVGTDSGFEGTTTIYYTHITAVFSRYL